MHIINENCSQNCVNLYFSKLEIFPEMKSCQDSEGERQADSEERSTHFFVSLEVNVKPVEFLHNVPSLARSVLVREGNGGDLNLQKLAESLPALPHPVHQEVGGRHQGLHCCIVSPVLVQPNTLKG